MNSAKLQVPGIAEEARRVNEAIDAEMDAVANSNSSCVTQLSELTRTKGEITARLPDLKEKALLSEDFASALTTANTRLELIESKISALKGQTAATVRMTGAAPLVAKVVAHYVQYLPEVLDEYFRPVASDQNSRNALMQIAEATRALGIVRDSFSFLGPKSATPGNRRQFTAIMRRAAAGQYHLLADCEPVPAREEASAQTESTNP